MKKLSRFLQLIFSFVMIIQISCTGKAGQGKTSLNQNHPIKGLILTGHHHPGHPWQETTRVINDALKQDERILVDITSDIENLSVYNLEEYDFLVLNYCNWEEPEGLSEKSKEAFTGYLKNGGGLLIIHFANGAWHFSLPGAEASDWPEYHKICRRMWDHQGGSTHDAYDTFKVEITDIPHFITSGMDDFETVDELYYNQAGDDPIEPLLVARSKNTGKDEPLAWVYNYGKGRIFQTLLGHDAASFEAPGMKEILIKAAIWVSEKNNPQDDSKLPGE